MVTQNLPKQASSVQKAKKHLTVVRDIQSAKQPLMPPRTSFNTGYLKGKQHDTL